MKRLNRVWAGKPLLMGVFGACALMGVVWGCRAQMVPPLAPMVEPTHDTVWTSTREVRALRYAKYELWAATSGGVLRLDAGKWTKWTRRDELPSHEALEFVPGGEGPMVRFPTATARYDGANWNVTGAPPFNSAPREVMWNGGKVRVELDGLRLGNKFYPLPSESGGTHISATWNVGPYLLVAIYGDGLWAFKGTWRRAAEYSPLPQNAREITALVREPDLGLWIGTRRDGLFHFAGEGAKDQKWQQVLQRGEPFAHNVQNFAEYGGVLWASTLDDGLIYRTGQEWRAVSTPILSSSAPRQMLVWHDQLYVRYGGGLVDSFDGRSWTKNAFKTVPRKGVYALAGDETTLFAAGWGGWSEWDGTQWTPHFDQPELKGIPLMGVLVQGDELWIATQSRGLGRFNRQTNEFRWFDERDGLPDDWITALTSYKGQIYVGTFVGGLARLDGEKWKTFDALKGQNVTALAESDGNLFAATRTGLWRVEGETAVRVEKSWLDSEVQALYPSKKGLWVGTRTSLNFLVNEATESQSNSHK